MARSRKYKYIDRSFGSNFIHGMGSVFAKIGRFFLRVFKIFDQKLTVMVVPHSKGKVFNIQTNVFALTLGIIIFGGIIGSFFYFNQRNITATVEIKKLREENQDTMSSLDELRDENNNLLQTAKRFQSSLSQSLSLLGIEQTNNTVASDDSGGDLSSLFNTQDITSGTLKETTDIRQLTAYLDSAVEPVEEIGRMLERQGTLFQDIPSVWPVKNGIGHISMGFGQNLHPLKQTWYIHKGLDISTWRSGDPVVATANGQVVTVGYSDDFGIFVILKHKHGIYTRYAHLSSARVSKGDSVMQRQVIGTIGDTGLTTGPHLHYEVHIGSDVVDPLKYINLK